MAQKAPGRHEREGMTTREIFGMFPDDGAAEQWFESIVWDEGRFCPHCGSLDTIERKSRKPTSCVFTRTTTRPNIRERRTRSGAPDR